MFTTGSDGGSGGVNRPLVGPDHQQHVEGSRSSEERLDHYHFLREMHARGTPEGGIVARGDRPGDRPA